MPRQDLLKLRFLGEIQIERGSQRLSFPQSKKTRALLAYLVLNGRKHRRERLCSLLWDVADDPRGALRWSLSRLRPLVDGPNRARVVSDRDSVSFDSSDMWVDAIACRRDFEKLGGHATSEQLKQIATIFRGEFLEGLDLPDFDEFQAWCIAEREQYRILHANILSALIHSLASDPALALPHARSLVQVNPHDESAHAQLVQLLLANGRSKEAERQHEAGIRILKEAGIPLSGPLRITREALRTVPQITPSVEPGPLPSRTADTQNMPRFVGRSKELATLRNALEQTETLRRERLILLTGEPGIGKTRLISEIAAVAGAKSATILEGYAYEAESLRPYGPWIDALSKVPATALGQTIAADLTPMIPELGPTSTAHTRDQMFGAVVELIAARAHSTGLVVLVLDDVQWCDEASAALLHYVVRSNRHRPVLILLGARSGELQDNSPMLRLIRGLRRDGFIEQLEIGPLSAEETQELAQQVNPVMKDLRVFEETAGNPLFTIEVARSEVLRQEDIPQSLADLVGDRIERLPPAARDILRWGAILGSAFTPATLAELPGLPPDTLMSVLEKLDRHGLIRYIHGRDGRDGAYTFTSNLVRRVAYADISEPRRRMMHGQVANLLTRLVEINDSVATDIVQHSALAGDIALAARACVGAARRCLKLFANVQAESFAKRGMRFAEQLEEPERTKLLIELTRISVETRRPDALQQRAREVEHLAERALDYGCMAHARLAFHVSSYLRWEDGDWSVAERNTLRAEVISRSAGEKERMVGLAEAARCLAMLERDLAHASSLLLEASQLAERIGEETVAVPIAEGLLHQHGGRNAHAVRSFFAALEIARRDRDRANEFSALEHLVMIKVDQREYPEAQSLVEDLAMISEKLREGSDAPFARVLRKLIAYGIDGSTGSALGPALIELRQCDAKYRLAFALTRAAQIDLQNGDGELAATHAAEGLEMARKLSRPSEVALALAILNRAVSDPESCEVYRQGLKDLRAAGLRGLSEHARSVVEDLAGNLETKDGGDHGNRSRRANVSRTNRP